MPIWQVVMAELGTYHEVANLWEPEALLDALELIEYKSRVQEYYQNKKK